MADTYDYVIIGGGVTGLAAAIYAGRFRMKTLLLGENVGGTITLTNDISNFPGFKQITGTELAKRIKEHAMEYGIEIKEKKVTRIERLKGESCFKVYIGDSYVYAKSLLFATGTIWKKLGVPGEKEFTNMGVHYCALCDGPLYKDKVVGIVGGSDAAAMEALLLAEYAKKVYMIYRGEQIRPEPITMERVLKEKKIEIINNANVKEIKGERFVNKVILDREFNGSKELKLDGVFIAIGHVALSDLAKGIGVVLDGGGQIIVNRNGETNIKGVYAAGDVTDTKFKQAITGVAEGMTATFSAHEYIKDHEIRMPKE